MSPRECGNVWGKCRNAVYRAIALLFLVLSFRIPCEVWQNNHIVMGMHYGTEMYSRIIENQYNGRPVYLMPQDLPSAISLDIENGSSISYSLDYDFDNIYGVIRDSH